VTKLGEFSPLGQEFPMGSFLKIKEIAKYFGAMYLFMVKAMQ
jgi:hypothetical protein